MLAADIPVSFDGTAQPVQAGRIRLFAGLRSDPFFADVEGALHGFVWTGHDDFADNNVDSIVLEVPNDMLGGPVIGVWASISRRSNGVLEQMDRGGNPTINPFINPDGEKNLFNSRQPADDVANYLEPWSAILQNAGGYTPEQARAAALQVLPDILHFDRTRPATYPNGRVPTDDVYSHALRLADQRQGPGVRPQAPRRPAAPLPLRRPAQPLAAQPPSRPGAWTSVPHQALGGAASTSAAARWPDRRAPSIRPAQWPAVCSPAKWMRPAGAARMSWSPGAAVTVSAE